MPLRLPLPLLLPLPLPNCLAKASAIPTTPIRQPAVHPVVLQALLHFQQGHQCTSGVGGVPLSVGE